MNDDRHIKHNRCKCLLCNQIIESKHRHDFVYCECGNVYVDGGKDYLRRGSNNFNYVEELSEYHE